MMRKINGARWGGDHATAMDAIVGELTRLARRYYGRDQTPQIVVGKGG